MEHFFQENPNDQANNTQERLSASHQSDNYKDDFNRESRKESNEEYDDKNKNIDRQDLPKQHLNFMLYMNKFISNYFTNNNFSHLNKIQSLFNDLEMQFDKSISIPDLEGDVLVIKGENIEQKQKALEAIFKEIIDNQVDKYANWNEETNKEETEKKKKLNVTALILVPNGLVSIVIGTKGKQIMNLINDAGCSIIVNQPVHHMLHRSITVSGRPENIAYAAFLIYKIMQERYYEVKAVEVECKPLEQSTTRTSVS